MSIRSRFIQTSLAVLMVATVASPSDAVKFPETSGLDAPARTPSFGTRGEICLDPSVRPSLTSLLPQNAIATAFGADTDIPLSLWFYIPQTNTKDAELTIVDSDGNQVYQKALDLPNTPGTIQVTMPTYQGDGITPMFEAGRIYYWDFALVCDPNERDEDVALGGGIQRLDASTDFLTQLDANDDPVAQAELYAQAGAWQETITLAATVRTQNPNTWTELLSSVGLDQVAAAPIVSQSALTVETSTPPVPNQVVSEETQDSQATQTSLQRLLDGINGRADQ